MPEVGDMCIFNGKATCDLESFAETQDRWRPTVKYLFVDEAAKQSPNKHSAKRFFTEYFVALTNIKALVCCCIYVLVAEDADAMRAHRCFEIESSFHLLYILPN